ncbi:MAG: AraC family transcriptional regulator [Ruminococcus sp.]|nr:AraC family transcriptional regulator [Ruminococcus sp.]
MKRKTYLQELYNEIMNRFPEHITIEQASKISGVSKTKLKADFQKEYGISYYSYFRKERMKLAAQLLLETKQKIIDIAEAVGYENSSKFAKAFRDVTGFSPSEYRRNMKKPVLFDNELANANKISERRIV